MKDAINAGVDSIEHASLADDEAIALALRNQVALSMDVYTVYTFLEERPDYNAQLKMKILQEADPVFRAYIIVEADQPD